MSRFSITAFVLAAGLGRRMGNTPKLLRSFGGQTVLEHSLSCLIHQPLNLLVVVGHQAEQLTPILAAKQLDWVQNPNYAEGMASTIRCGVKALATSDQAVMICLADMPLVKPSTVTLLVKTFSQLPKDAILVPIYNGQRGHPVIFGSAYQNQLARLKGDRGAKSILNQFSNNVVQVVVADPGILRDVDTPQDFDKLRN